MGENLVLNMESKGFRVSVFNRTVEKVDKFMEGRGKGLNIYGAHSLEEIHMPYLLFRSEIVAGLLPVLCAFSWKVYHCAVKADMVYWRSDLCSVSAAAAAEV